MIRNLSYVNIGAGARGQEWYGHRIGCSPQNHAITLRNRWRRPPSAMPPCERSHPPIRTNALPFTPPKPPHPVKHRTITGQSPILTTRQRCRLRPSVPKDCLDCAPSTPLLAPAHLPHFRASLFKMPQNDDAREYSPISQSLPHPPTSPQS